MQDIKSLSLLKQPLLEETQKMLQASSFSKKCIKDIKLTLDLYKKMTFERFLTIFEKNKIILQEVLIEVNPRNCFESI